METIRQLLNRIRWDESFGRGSFEAGIYDRITDRLEFHPLDDLQFEEGNRFSFRLLVDGQVHSVPFHRIREVRKNGETIWSRG